MNTSQPVWKLVANLGDVNPIEYGGVFVYVDTTGVYDPECEVLTPPCDDMDFDDPKAQWEVRRFVLEACTYVDGVLSDNRFHKDHPVWFAKSLGEVASYIGQTEASLIQAFTSGTPAEKAMAWKAVGDYHGMDNLDSYPLFYNRQEIESAYSKGKLCNPA